ncbi:MAG: DUF5131 family protein [Eubacteriaceae bacterium]|nr:DUF5131 family protein [Eubacteriaceae bacterium]
MSKWDPWRGCHRVSEGCKYCYIHKGDAKRGVDTSIIQRSEKFDAPIAKKKNGEYRMASGQLVNLCFSSDFLIEEADEWRKEAWRIIAERRDLTFFFLTKRINRFMDCIPEDWGEGYDNVIIGVSVENQVRADERLGDFITFPIKHRYIICGPMIGPMDLTNYLKRVELVTANGESDKNARILDYNWVLALRDQCIEHNVNFQFRQCGSHFLKEDKLYNLPVNQLCAQARKAGIDFVALPQ